MRVTSVGRVTITVVLRAGRADGGGEGLRQPRHLSLKDCLWCPLSCRGTVCLKGNFVTDAIAQLATRLHAMPGPFLFVGSGLSRRYAGLPDWEGLLRHFAAATSQPYEYYRGAAAGDKPAIASLIADEFYEIWWSKDEYVASREHWAHLVTDRPSALKIEVSQHLRSLFENATLPPLETAELEAFAKTTVEGVITTNYDPLLASVFPEFRTFVGQDELLLSDTQGIAETYMIHGSIDAPMSLVLTADDYQDFNERNAYLAAKLMTIFVEHPVLFLGYSLSDENIRSMLTALVRGLRGKSTSALEGRLILVEWEPSSPASIADSFIQIDAVDVPIVRISVPDFVELFGVLAQRVRALPARVLRVLKEQVFEIVKEGDPSGRLFAVSELDDTSHAIDVVFGVGAKMTAVGVIGLSRFDLIDDVLSDPERELPARQILDAIVQKRSLREHWPIFKYLRRAGWLDVTGAVDPANRDVPPKVRQRAEMVERRLRGDAGASARTSIAELEATQGIEWLFIQGLALAKHTLDADGLRTFLIAQRSYRTHRGWSTQYAKLAVVYDWLQYAAVDGRIPRPRDLENPDQGSMPSF